MKQTSNTKPYLVHSSWIRNEEAPAEIEKSLLQRCKDEASTFIRRTTIPGLVQISNSSSLVGKLLWFIILFVGICITVQQSYNVIDQYMKYAVFERTERHIELIPPLPSVTICANNLLNINAPGNHSKIIWDRVLKFQSGFKDIVLLAAHTYEKNLIKEIAALPVAERIKVGFSYKDLVIKCLTAGKTCRGQIITTHSLTYGNCYTLNPYFDRTSESNFSEDVTVYLQSPWDLTTNSLPQIGPTVIIHERRTAPPLQPQHMYPIFPQKWASFKMHRRVIHRLEAPYASQCMPNHDENAMKESYYYSENTPYEYTWEACVQTCLQKNAIEVCNCYMKNVPLPPNSTKDLEYCTHYSDTCAELLAMASKICQCPQRCRETVYHVDAEQNDRWYLYGGGADYVASVILRSVANKPNPETICGFKLTFTASYFETIREVEEISWTTILGSIGGSLGLWIGLSVVSLGEIFDFLIRLFCVIARYALDQSCTKAKVNNSY